MKKPKPLPKITPAEVKSLRLRFKNAKVGDEFTLEEAAFAESRGWPEMCSHMRFDGTMMITHSWLEKWRKENAH